MRYERRKGTMLFTVAGNGYRRADYENESGYRYRVPSHRLFGRRQVPAGCQITKSTCADRCRRT